MTLPCVVEAPAPSRWSPGTASPPVQIPHPGDWRSLPPHCFWFWSHPEQCPTLPRMTVMMTMTSLQNGIRVHLPTAREGNVFTSVCQSFCLRRGGLGVFPSMQLGREVCIPVQQGMQRQGVYTRGTPPNRGTHPDQKHAVVLNAAVGTHPTGMHSC